MRSTTFDMIAMMLMAILVITTTGGILTWRYFSQPGGADEATDRGSDAVTTERSDDRSEESDDSVLVER